MAWIAMTGFLFANRSSARPARFVETIRTSGEALLTIINDILNFSKSNPANWNSNSVPGPACVCRRSVDLLASKPRKRGLNLLYEFDSNTPETLVGDITRCGKILVNPRR